LEATFSCRFGDISKEDQFKRARPPLQRPDNSAITGLIDGKSLGVNNLFRRQWLSSVRGNSRFDSVVSSPRRLDIESLVYGEA
jgi:hypothetical protein